LIGHRQDLVDPPEGIFGGPLGINIQQNFGIGVLADLLDHRDWQLIFIDHSFHCGMTQDVGPGKFTAGHLQPLADNPLLPAQSQVQSP
jgi:hypothetical protein